MAKRLGLNKLISYVMTNCVAESKIEDIYDIADSKNVTLEDINFINLPYGDSKNIGDLPQNLKTIFDPFIKDIRRYGVKSAYKNGNCSLLFSILYCIDDNFKTLLDSDKEIYITKLKDKLFYDITNKKLFYEYNYKDLSWKIDDLKESVDKLKNNKMLLRYLADYFNINIFLLNITEDKIYSVYSDKNCNIFKVNIILSFYNDIFEPLEYIITKSCRWLYDTEPLKKLINVDKSKIIVMNFNFDINSEHDTIEFTVGSFDTSKYFPQQNTNQTEDKNNEYEEIVDCGVEQNDMYINNTETEINLQNTKSIDENDIFFKQNEVVKKTVVNIYKDLENLSDKMKLNELQELAKKYKISLDHIIDGKKKKKTKNQLVVDLNGLIVK